MPHIARQAQLQAIDTTLQPEVNLALKPFNNKALNSTAYRIFKLLEWLIQSPLSVEALNQKFLADPVIQKPVSNDSIWLYISTLRQLGCQIRRPSPRNNFQYELLAHPFHQVLTPLQIETLAQAKAYAQKQFNHQEVRTLDRLLKKVIQHSLETDATEAIESLFAQSRSFDLDQQQEHIAKLDGWLPEAPLLEILYHSPLKGLETFLFLPEMLYYEQGLLYLRGDHAHHYSPSSLRVDRIHELNRVEDEALRQELLLARQIYTTVHLRIYPKQPADWAGFELEAYHGVYSEEIAISTTGIDAYFEVRDFFYLKQRLLAQGLPFQVITPDSFRDDLQNTLATMLKLYQQEFEEGNDGHC